MGEALSHVLRRESVAQLAQSAQGAEYGVVVLALVDASQLAVELTVVHGLQPEALLVGSGCEQRTLVLGEVDGSLHLAGLGLEHRACLVVVLADDHRRVGFDDACLLRGYLGQRVAQELHVVEADVGDDAEVRTDDVGAVEPSAQAYLHHGHVHPLLGEIIERHGGRQLEERGVQRLEERAVALHEIDHRLLGDRLPIHADALAEVHQVGRRVEPCAVACLLQDGRQRVRA